MGRGFEIEQARLGTAKESTTLIRDAPSAEQKVKVVPIVISCAVCAISDLNFSMLVPFFPEAAERHGCTPTVTGMLFGLHQAVALLVTPVAPFLCQRFGGAGVLRAACFLQAATAFSFAFTDLATTTTAFVVACASLRAVQGLAAGLSEVAAVGLLMRSVPSELVGDAIGWSEAARGVGIMIGPLIGGGLDEAIGYEAPFFCSGSTLGLLALYMTIIPLSVEVVEEGSGGAMGRLLRMPVILSSLFVCYILMFTVGFLDPTIEPFLANPPYALDELQVGLMYSSSLFTYALCSACAGPVARRLGTLTALSIGLSILSACFITMAPEPWSEIGGNNTHGKIYPLSPVPFLAQGTRAGAIGLALGSLCMMGIGGALAFTPVNAIMVHTAELGGLSVDQSSDSIAALSMLAFTAGEATGPLAGGGLVELIGFQRACVICGYLVILTIVLQILTSSCVSCRRRVRPPLLQVEAVNGERLLENGPRADAETRGSLSPSGRWVSVD